LLYRQAFELHMKAVVGEGSPFLALPTGRHTLYKTHSLSWLAQIVCQMFKKVGWENEFACQGVSNLADFTALVNEFEESEPVGNRARRGQIPTRLQKSKVAELLPKLDVLLKLLAATADALAAEWDQPMEIGFKPMVHELPR
jgi:hypothetical protein